MASPVKDAAWVAWVARLMGSAPRQRQSAALAPNLFHCLLDELPLHLVPRAVFDRARPGFTSQPLFLNPMCSVLSKGQIPDSLQHRPDLFEGFDLDTTVAWVEDPVTGAINPFWLGPRLGPIVSRLSGRQACSDSISEDDKFLLATANILVPANHSQHRTAEWNRILNTSANAFLKNNYVPLPNLIHPFSLAALRRYYRHAIRLRKIRLGDEQSSLRYVAHNEPVARFFHHQIAPVVSAIAAEQVKPSYVYLASYLSGAELKKHTDREQCEFSVTLCLDFSPEPELATPWPIRLDTPRGAVTVYQSLGDGLVYRGTKVPHYRHVLASGHTSTSIFFHYVGKDFSGPLN